MEIYLDLMRKVMDEGVDKADRTGTGARSLFGHQMRFDLNAGFPLLTTKEIHLRSIIYELLWFIKGDTNVAYLQSNGVTIWDEWADKDGNLGPVYGHQWRNWGGDQLAQVIENIQSQPDSRRHIVSAWNVAEIPNMALPPCHLLYQFYVAEQRLSCQIYQRSADLFLGVPFNIASYALLTMMVAQVCGLKLGDLVHVLGDVHIYHNHYEAVQTQLQRTPHPNPTMHLNPKVKNLEDFDYDDFELRNYKCHPRISAPVAV